MSNAEIISNDQWSDRPLTEAQQKNRQSAELIPFGEHGVTPQSFAQAVDFAKMMSTARGAVPKHLVGNTGACLAVIELASKFQMSAYMLAMGCFSVNDMLAFTGQTVMAIINKHLPLAKDDQGNRTRLKYRFEGEHAQWEMNEVAETDRDDRPTGKKIWVRKLIKQSSRKIFVSARMEGEADELVYESPIVALITNKNSPLWVEDEDQQLIYWASRRWQRRWWPEGMLGIYDNEELATRHIGSDNAKLIEASDNPGQALLERVAAAKAQTADADQAAGVTVAREGFTADHAHNETNGHTSKSDVAEKPSTENATAAASEGGPGQASDQPDVTPADDFPEHIVLPKTVADWKVHALNWINDAKADPKATYDDMVKQWKAEIGLRNDCGVSGAPDVRDEVYDYFLTVRDDKPKTDTEKAAKKKK